MSLSTPSPSVHPPVCYEPGVYVFFMVTYFSPCVLIMAAHILMGAVVDKYGRRSREGGGALILWVLTFVIPWYTVFEINGTSDLNGTPTPCIGWGSTLIKLSVRQLGVTFILFGLFFKYAYRVGVFADAAATHDNDDYEDNDDEEGKIKA